MYNRIKQTLARKQPVEVNEAHRARTAALAREAYAQRKACAPIGFVSFCFQQIGFFGWQIWLMQMLLLLCLSIGIRLSYITAQFPLSVSAPFVLRASAIAIALTALPTLYRSAKYRMFEVEISTRAGYSRLLLSRLALIGFGDLLALAGLLAFSALYTDMGLINALFCLLLPFLTVLAAFLLLLPRIPIRILPCALLGISAAMLIMVAALGARLPDIGMYPLWCLISAILVAVCATQLSALNRQGGFADVQFL